MQSDNLEKLFKEKVREVEQAPLPKSQWNKDAAFLRVQNQLKYKETKTRKLYYRAAAVLLLGVLSSLFLYRMLFTDRSGSNNLVHAEPEAPQQANYKPLDEKRNESVAGDTVRKDSVAKQLAQARSPRKPLSKEKAGRNIQKIQESKINKPEISPLAFASVADSTNKPAAPPTNIQLPQSTQALAPSPKSIEVVVVLGGKTLDRMAEEIGREGVALGNEKYIKDKPIRKALKKEENKTAAISRIKNPLSINTEI